MIFVIITIVGCLIIAIIVDFWPDSAKRKKLIEDATGDVNCYKGLGKKYQPTDDELREMIAARTLTKTNVSDQSGT